LIHRLTHRHTNHDNIHVRGYKEEGAITTPFDLTVLNDLDRSHLGMDTIERLRQTGDRGISLQQQLKDKLIDTLSTSTYMARIFRRFGVDVERMSLYVILNGETAWLRSGQHTGRSDPSLREHGDSRGHWAHRSATCTRHHARR
jgi:hypothetical protein